MVVLGAGADEIAAGVDLHGADPVVCARWEEGQSASLACGLAELAGCEAVVVTLGDQPRISPDAIRRVIAARNGAAAVRATYHGNPGHPVAARAQPVRAAPQRVRRQGRAQPAPQRSRCSTCPVTTSAAARTWTRRPSWTRCVPAARSRAPPRAVKLEQSFEVRAPVERVWETLIDVERVAPCLPGAEITEARRGRHLSRHLQRPPRPDHGRLPRRAEHRGGRRGGPPRRRCARAARTSAARARQRRRSSAPCGQEGERHPGRRGHRLHDHRPARPLRPRRDDPGHLEPASEGLRRLPPAEDRGARRRRSRATPCSPRRRRAPRGARRRRHDAPTTAKPVGGFSLFFRALLDRVRRLFGRR